MRNTPMKPVERIGRYLKYGFVVTEHQFFDCPACGYTLGIGPNYQPMFCDCCGQRISYSGIRYRKDRDLGYTFREAM